MWYKNIEFTAVLYKSISIAMCAVVTSCGEAVMTTSKIDGLISVSSSDIKKVEQSISELASKYEFQLLSDKEAPFSGRQGILWVFKNANKKVYPFTISNIKNSEELEYRVYYEGFNSEEQYLSFIESLNIFIRQLEKIKERKIGGRPQLILGQ